MNKTGKILLWSGIGIVVAGVGLYYPVKLYLNQKKAGADNAEKLKTLNTAFDDKISQLVAFAKKQGYDVTVTSANRTFEKQAQLYKEDSRNAKPGRSIHNFGAAIDMTLSKDGKYYGKATSRSEWEKTGIPQYTEKLGIYWGANIPGYFDPVHFQYTKGLDINQFVELKEKQGVEGNKVKIPLKNYFVMKDVKLLKSVM